jgi:hypothetical protein
MNRIKRRRLEQRARFRQALSNGFKNGAIENLEDLINVYKGIHGLAGDDTTYRASLARHLRRHIASLADGEAAELDNNEIASLKRKLSVYLRQIESENPYTDLPSAERTILLDVSELINVGSKEPAIKKLDALLA